MAKQVTIIGVGCSICRMLIENIGRVAEELGVEIQIEQVTDIQEMIRLGIASIPALVVSDKVVYGASELESIDLKQLLM